MGWWTEQVVPRVVDASLSKEPVTSYRADVCAGLRGRVLQVGFGSGLDLPHLPAAVTRLDAVEPSDVAWQRSAERRGAARVPVERTGLDGQRLDAPDDSYDAALCTFTLCTIPDVERALAEVRRVLRPGAALHVLEHGASPRPGARRWQGRFEPLQRRLCGGCHLTRDPEALLAAAGFSLHDVGHTDVAPGPGRVWGHLTWARAVAA